MMTYHGHVQNGVVLLDDDVKLPDGAEVQVEVVGGGVTQSNDNECPTLYEQFKPIIGVIGVLPADFAANHDHYIHGQPKK
jgi:hypothetical protein